MVGGNSIALVWWHLEYSLVLVPQPRKAIEGPKDMEKTTNLVHGSEVCSSGMIQVALIKLLQPGVAVLLGSFATILPSRWWSQGWEDTAEVEELVEEAGSATVKRQERLDRTVLVSMSGCRREQAWAAHWLHPYGTEDVVQTVAPCPVVLCSKSTVAIC